jgi:hypothetical protein
MKTQLILIHLGIAFSSTLASAASYGTPDQDPVVKDLRQRFEAGKQPSSHTLLHHAYDCKEMTAIRNNFDKNGFKSELTFTQFDGYLIEHLRGQTNGQYFVGNGQEWVATAGLENARLGTAAYRMDSKGYLIGEWSILDSGSTTAELSPIASAPIGSKVISYQLCVEKTK